jgi:alcohol dehydrogenase (cytochrome c)
VRLGGVLQPITPEGPMELGEPDVGKNKENTAGAIEPSGTLSAINVNTGKIEWQYHSDYPMLGGVMVTAGNLVFAGEFNGQFNAFNATTGEKLWHFQMGAGVNASPVTYMVDGTQYVAIAAGGNAANGNNILMEKLGLHFGDEIGIFAVNTHAAVAN